jgi:transposase InsO family protein
VFGAGSDRSLTGPAAVARFAADLGVDVRAARQALHQVAALSGDEGVNASSPAFAAIARELGVTSGRLAAALAELKRAFAGGPR